MLPATTCTFKPLATRYFFFGTLMDVDVLSVVLDRPVDPALLVPARLDGYRRRRLADDSFPMLLVDPAAAVDGVVFESTTNQDDARILFFEDRDYTLRPCHPVLIGNASIVEAVFCGARDGTEASDKDWQLDRWAANHKRSFLDLSRLYMACFGRMTSQEAEVIWEENREPPTAEG